MTRNIQEERGNRLRKAWTEEFIDLQKRQRFHLVLLVAILTLEVLHWFI